MPVLPTSIVTAIRDRIAGPRQPRVWTAEDFADLGARAAIDQALHRLMASGKIRRIARGLYDLPGTNRLTGKPTSPDPRAVIDALARKGNVRILVDGITAANDLGLTDAVPGAHRGSNRWPPAAHQARQSDPRLSLRRAQPSLLGRPPRHALCAGAPLAARHAALRRRSAPPPPHLHPSQTPITGRQSVTTCARLFGSSGVDARHRARSAQRGRTTEPPAKETPADAPSVRRAPATTSASAPMMKRKRRAAEQ